MRCGLYMKCALPMAPGKHFCNSNNNKIKKNFKECRAILDTLLETDKSDNGTYLYILKISKTSLIAIRTHFAYFKFEFFVFAIQSSS